MGSQMSTGLFKEIISNGQKAVVEMTQEEIDTYKGKGIPPVIDDQKAKIADLERRLAQLEQK